MLPATHLAVPTRPVLFPQHVHEPVVDDGTMWEHKRAAGAELVEEEQALLLADEAVVPLPCLLHARLPLREFLLRRK